MSGEGIGTIIGGLALVGALPVVLAGVAVVGAAAGAVALGKGVAKIGGAAWEQRKLQIEGCSQEVSAFYDQLQRALDAQNRASREFYGNLQQQMESLSGELRQAAKEGSDQLEDLLRKAREDQAQAVGTARTQEMERIRRETEQETQTAMKALQEAQRAKLEVLDWKASTAAARANQQALARDLLRDAQATVALLKRIGTQDAGFQRQVEAVERSCRNAALSLEQGACQAAAAGAQQVVSRGASLALEQELAQRERDEVRGVLEAQLDALLVELDCQAVLKFHDDLYGTVEEPMDDFTQGAFGALRQKILDLQQELRTPEGQAYGAGKLQLLLEAVETDLTAQADQVLRMGHQKVLQYYQRLHALETVSGYMEEQGYELSWIQPAGGDVTQALVVSFREPSSGNTISVSLDGKELAEEDEIKVRFYYADGREVTEEEKAAVRAGVLGSLEEKGLTGEIHCSGCVGQEAADQSLRTPEAVQALPRKPIAFQE